MENLFFFSLLGLNFQTFVLLLVAAVGGFSWGYYKGRWGQKALETITENILDDLIEEGYLKTRRTFNSETGAWDTKILKHDEEL